MEKRIESKRSCRFAVVKKVLVYGILFCFTFLFITYLMACWSIRSSVKEISAEATQQYQGDRVEALIAYINSEDHNLKEKNHVVWALGQLGDERALPVLEKSYTGQPCNHDKSLCQRELRRAIKLCKGGLNLTAWLPR
ncbi:MAG: HEAT repeat domain-containing protein [Phycisphaerae bacterium]